MKAFNFDFPELFTTKERIGETLLQYIKFVISLGSTFYTIWGDRAIYNAITGTATT